MTSNKRNSDRIGLVIEIKLTCEDKSEFLFNSRNISDTGVFLEINDETPELAIGTSVVLQVCSQLGDESPPPVNAEIARITDEGLGLKFV